MKQQTIVNELKRELAMRRKVWREIPGSPGVFVSAEHTRQFAAMQAALDLVEGMTAAEYNQIFNRLAARKEAGEAQGKLF